MVMLINHYQPTKKVLDNGIKKAGSPCCNLSLRNKNIMGKNTEIILVGQPILIQLLQLVAKLAFSK